MKPVYRAQADRLSLAVIARLAGVLERLHSKYKVLLTSDDKRFAEEQFSAIRESLAELQRLVRP